MTFINDSLDWRTALEEVLKKLEDAEMALSNEGPGRKSSGSYYTPADVADHFWRLFWRHHQVFDKSSAVSLIDRMTFVEPSVGAGMFFFSMLKSLSDLGVGPKDASLIRFKAIDLNRAALELVADHITALEVQFDVEFKSVELERADFLEWVARQHLEGTAFVGNPPFVANERGSQWKNLYADFVSAMLEHGDGSGIGLILPVSLCFSRDYIGLRRRIRDAALPLSASSYDNMPDYLFKAGKPDSGNTNKANSQRCTILNLGGPRTGVVESSALLRWSSSERAEFLASTPEFHDCAGFDIERQIPRPNDASLSEYLHEADGHRTVRELMSRIGKGAFAVGGVARNFIGIRDYDAPTTGVTPVRTNEHDATFILLQVLSSNIFYKYWRSFGDGFHVTTDLIDRFPISKRLLHTCEQNIDNAESVWKRRSNYAKEKLNSGKVVRSYDFSAAFPTM
jgi:hypothetical protein